MKRGAPAQQRQRRRAGSGAPATHAAPPPTRRPPPPAADEPLSDDEREPVPAPSKRPRHMVPVHASSEDSGSDPGPDSGDSQSDDEGGSSSGEEAGGGGEGGGLPLGQLAALRQDGSTSAAAMKARARALRAQGGATFKRQGKHRPTEMSSRRPVPVLRETLQGPKRAGKDPRFESLSGGQYKEEAFKKRYAFLYDEKLPAERAELRAALGRAKGEAAAAALSARLQHVEQQLRSEEARRAREAFKQQLGAKERAAVRQGKAPFFPKKGEVRRQELVARYEQLAAAGGGQLDRFLAKRRRRNAAKDHRHLPAGRRAAPGAGGE